ncbi:MAG: DUF5398 family protein [Chlamydiales bacterium]|nr:DUF5398 family protein [Chlamydiales bacterium]
MFGMESGKKKKMADFTFDLENDIKDPGKLRALKEQVEERIGQLKNMLRGGGEKAEFDDAQTLLHGYLAVQKVLQRVNRKLV